MMRIYNLKNISIVNCYGFQGKKLKNSNLISTELTIIVVFKSYTFLIWKPINTLVSLKILTLKYFFQRFYFIKCKESTSTKLRETLNVFPIRVAC